MGKTEDKERNYKIVDVRDVVCTHDLDERFCAKLEELCAEGWEFVGVAQYMVFSSRSREVDQLRPEKIIVRRVKSA